MTYQVHTTIKSNNRKVGKIPVTTTSADTCPDVCPFNNANEGGCYANGGPLAMHWAKVTKRERGDGWSTFIAKVKSFKVGELWRHNQAGDLAGDGKLLDADANAELADANTGKRGWTYTHYPVLTSKHNAQVVKHMNDKGFVVNLSGNNLKHADALYDLGIAPVTTVLPADQMTNTTTPKGRKVVICPAVVKDDVACVDCQLCARMRDAIVGFPAHGVSKRKADQVAQGV
jgi:ferredoxin